MSPREIEESVYRVEGVRIHIQAPTNVDMGDFEYVQRYPDKHTINMWLKNRIKPLIGNCDVTITHSDGSHAAKNMLMGNIRRELAQNKR